VAILFSFIACGLLSLAFGLSLILTSIIHGFQNDVTCPLNPEIDFRWVAPLYFLTAALLLVLGKVILEPIVSDIKYLLKRLPRLFHSVIK
jgi:hypothetical protein